MSRFWAGEFGSAYADRNRGQQALASKIHMFSVALRYPVESAVEFGANIGLNLLALKALFPGIRLSAVEINTDAAAELRGIEGVEVHERSALEPFEGEFDLAFTSGVLIHIHPDHLPKVYDNLYRCGRRILIAEYYSPAPVSIHYRGHADRLFKRDFAGEMLDRYPLRILDYGFQYRRDPAFPADDLTWFLLERA